MRIQEIVDIVGSNSNIKIGKNLDITQYSGVVKYHPEELVIIVKAGTNNRELREILAKNNQGFDFWTDDSKTIGGSYCLGGSAIRGSVLGVQLIDGNGDILNFGGEVMKNVAGYDIARLLCGSRGKCGIITQISFKILPLAKITQATPPQYQHIDATLIDINTKIAQVFDKKGKFA
jgi:glycolate oxidase FAD binding subunit